MSHKIGTGTAVYFGLGVLTAAAMGSRAAEGKRHFAGLTSAGGPASVILQTVVLWPLALVATYTSMGTDYTAGA